MRNVKLAATVALAAVATLGFWWLTFDAHDDPVAAPLPQQVPSAPLPDAAARPAAVTAATNGEEPVETTLEDVYLACDGLLHGVLPDYEMRDGAVLAAPDCLAALDGLFLEESASNALLPVSPPLRWRDLFDDVAGDVSAVVAAAGDPDCAVPEGDIRPELGAACAARPMVELAAMAHACGNILVGAFKTPASGGWGDVTLETPGRLPVLLWRTISGLYSNYDRDGQARQRMIDQYAASSSDQQTFLRQRRDEDRLRFRTAWLASKCMRDGAWLTWMAARPRQFDNMMARAARLGDSFALAHDTGTPERARRLLAINPAQAYLHLAALESNRIESEWARKVRSIDQEAREPYLEVRRQYLALAGVECPAPCSEENLRALETEHERTVWIWRTRCYIDLPNCPLAEKIEELEAALKPARVAAGQVMAPLREEYRSRIEAVRLKYVIAAETAAAAAGVELRARGYADEARLDGYRLHLARVAAQAMIAEHRAQFGTGGSSDASPPP